ncbi:MAG: hypothetical protein DCF20_00125 [Pseudanabaena sp.]|nr:MAG: hypothetical protein DCF20_00125 [Pseudanabaena sp.]
MKFYSPIGQHQIGYPQVWQRANCLAVSRFVATILGRDIELYGDVFGDRENLVSPAHPAKQDLRIDTFNSISSFNAFINPETYPLSGRYRHIAVPT